LATKFPASPALITQLNGQDDSAIDRSKSGLSYIPAPRYAARMMDFTLMIPAETASTKDYTRPRIGVAEPAIFCRFQPKFTENINNCFCKDDRIET